MMDKLNNAQRAEIARFLASNKAEIRYALVTGYDPDLGLCTVNIQPEGVLTGWLPILRQQIGNLFGCYFAPNINDQCLVAHVEGDRNVGIILGFLPSDEDPAPSVPAGEAWIVHKTGSFLKFTTDGSVSLTTNKDLIATVGGKITGTVTGDCNLTVSGKTVLACSDVELGASGGKKVVLDGDPVIGGGGGTVQASSTKVKAT